MTRPRGSPPTPSAMSRPTEPVGIVPISAMSPPDSGMIAPLPNCFSMAAMAPATAFSFSFMLDMGLSLVRSLVDRGRGTGGPRRGARCAIAALPARSAIVRATRRTRVMARADRPEPRGRPFQQRVAGAVERRHPPQLGGRQARVPALAARLLALARRHDARRGWPRSIRPARRARAPDTAARGRRRAGRCDRAAAPTAANGRPTTAARRADAGADACCRGARTDRG